MESAGQSDRLLKPSPCIAALDAGATKEATALRIKATAILIKGGLIANPVDFLP